MSKEVLLTISILISNRPATVRKCLDSVKPLLENVPSELILVDTGCGAEVRSIIKEYTDKIIEFEWCRDFSKARNAGLEKAKGKWFLFLDDDEWFNDVTEMIDFFQSGEYKDYGMAVYTQRNYLEKNGSVYTDLLVGRMTKLYPDTRFIYRIHECFNRVSGRTKKFNNFVHHYGYVYASSKESRAHSMRNISLLLEEHEADPGNMKHTLQLAQEYNVLDEYSKSLEMSLEAVSLYEKGKINNEYFLSSLFGNEIGCYMDLFRYDEAIEKGELYLKHKRPDKMTKDLIAGFLATAYMERKDYAKVLEYVKYYWEGYQDYLRDEESFMEFVTTITNKCFEEHNRSSVLGNGIRAAAILGQGELAWKWFESFDWKAQQMFVSEEMIKAVVERMPKAAWEEREYYVKMCNTMMGRNELEGHVLRGISDYCRSRESLKERVEALAAYDGVESGHWFFKLKRIVTEAFLPWDDNPGTSDTAELKPKEAGPNAGGKDDAVSGNAAAFCNEAECAGAAGTGHMASKPAERNAATDQAGQVRNQETEDLAAEIWENPGECMSMVRTYSMLEAVERLGGSNRRILERIPFYLWKKGIMAYFEQFSWEDADWWNGQFTAILPREESRMLVWRGMYGLSGAIRAAGQLEKLEASSKTQAVETTSLKEQTDADAWLSGKDAEAGFASVRESLKEYAACQKELCERIYRPEIIEQARDMFPEEYQGAYLVADLLRQTQEEKYGEAVGTIKAIRKLLPGLTNVMKPYLQWINARLKRQTRESRQAAGEFQVLARQIKMRLRAFMDAGQYQAALAVAKQLETLLPEDPEIREIIERLG